MNEKREENNRLQKALEALIAHFENKAEDFTPDRRDEVQSALESLQSSVGALTTEREAGRRIGYSFDQIQGEQSNILPFRRARGPVAVTNAERFWTLRLDCLIESRYVSEIHKMAMELHAHSQRYAFIEFRDLAAEVRTSSTELMNLGGISLFIPSILDLTTAEQLALAEICRVDTIQRPLLMVGSPLPYSELRGEASVNGEFLALMMRAYIKLSKPFREYKEQGLIYYFLDSLSTSPT